MYDAPPTKTNVQHLKEEWTFRVRFFNVYTVNSVNSDVIYAFAKYSNFIRVDLYFVYRRDFRFFREWQYCRFHVCMLL